MTIPSIDIKLGRMRKAQDCVIYPGAKPERVMIQGDKFAGVFNCETLTATIQHKNGYFQLLPSEGYQVEFSQELADEILSKAIRQNTVVLVGA